jgi:transposase
VYQKVSRLVPKTANWWQDVNAYDVLGSRVLCNVLRRLREDIRWKRPELWHAGNWLLHDDNAPSHQALITCEFLTHNNIITLPHPPNSPDLAPCDFLLFPKMKLQLNGQRFDRVEEIQGNCRIFLVRFENRISRRGSSCGNSAGIDVSLHKGTILNGMLSKLKSSKYILVYRSGLGTFWYTFIHDTKGIQRLHVCRHTCPTKKVWVGGGGNYRYNSHINSTDFLHNVS